MINGDTSYMENMTGNTTYIQRWVGHVKSTNMYVQRICETIIHIRHVELPQYRVNHEMNNQSMRVLYMRKKITEEEFKINLQRKYLSNQKKNEMLNILQMTHDTCNDIILRFKDEITTRHWKYSINTLSEIDGIIEYTNDCLGKISRIYNSTRKILGNTLRWSNQIPTFPTLLPIPLTDRVFNN
jgi:hypothetical protein